MSKMDPKMAAYMAHMADTIRAMLGEDYDDETFLDTLDGETDAMDILDKLLARYMDAKAMGEAVKAQKDALATRQARMESRATAYRVAMRDLLAAIGQTKIERPLGTASITKGRVSVEYTDKDAVPTQLRRLGPPDGTAIRKALDAGETVPGAQLKTGEDSLTVRVA